MAHEFDGNKYEKASAHQREWGNKLISDLGLKGNERVLDLGCGNGAVTAAIADALPEGGVVGLDASEGMIKTARTRERANLSFVLMDINDLSFHGEFDVVFSNAALHWVKDHAKLLRNVSNALKKGGFARFNFAADGNCPRFFKVVRTAMELGEYAGFLSEFSWPWYMPPVDGYNRLVEKAGFSTARVWGENADRYFPDTEAMIGWLDQPSLVPFLAVIPEEHRAGFREYVIDRMIAETKQDDGRCFETFRRINLFAEK